MEPGVEEREIVGAVLKLAMMTFVHTDSGPEFAVEVVRGRTDLLAVVRTGRMKLVAEEGSRGVMKVQEVQIAVILGPEHICLVMEHWMAAHYMVTVLAVLAVASYSVRLVVTRLFATEHKHLTQMTQVGWEGIVIGGHQPSLETWYGAAEQLLWVEEGSEGLLSAQHRRGVPWAAVRDLEVKLSTADQEKVKALTWKSHWASPDGEWVLLQNCLEYRSNSTCSTPWMVAESQGTDSMLVVEGRPRWTGNHHIEMEQASLYLAFAVEADRPRRERRDSVIATIVGEHRDWQTEHLLKAQMYCQVGAVRWVSGKRW